MAQQVLCHGDPNVFNILVEPKPAIETLEHFGPRGDMVIVDFEMAFVGPHGKDTGWFIAFPIAAILSHSAHGHREQMAMQMFGQSLCPHHLRWLPWMGWTNHDVLLLHGNAYELPSNR